MIRFKMKIYNMILIEKLQNYQPYHQAKLTSMSILLVKKYYLLIKKKKIKQVKFTYSPLGKAFGKQTKTVADQGGKQVRAIKDNKTQLANTNANDHKNELLLSKERETFKNIYNERLNNTEGLTKKLNHDDLNFIVQSSGDETNFTKVDDPIVFLNDIKTGTIRLEEAKN